MPTVSQTDPFLWHLAPLGVTHDPGTEVDGAVPPDQTEYVLRLQHYRLDGLISAVIWTRICVKQFVFAYHRALLNHT